MRQLFKTGILLMACVLIFVSPAAAAVEKGESRVFELAAKPIDMVVSADGQHTYILAEGGNVFILDGSGSLKGSLQVSKSVVSIGTSPDGSYLLLADGKNKTLEAVRINFVVDIDVTGLPFKGPADGPVLITVFSDYQ